MKNKKALEMNFALLFAIIAGAAILVLAIYGATKLGEMKRYQTDTEIAKEISVITDPMQAGFAEGSFGKIVFNQETEINNICFSSGFGKNEVSVSTYSRFGGQLSSGGATSIYNKYIFSPESQTAEQFYVFSKPFYLPYKISDLIFLTSKNYCFLHSPEEIEDEISGLRMPNVKTANCSSDSVRICFNSFGCDVNIFGTCMENCNSAYDEGYVEKGNERLYYSGSLLYGAIFSDPDVYECNVKRLLYRTAEIAKLYEQKADLMNARSCSTNLKADLILFRALAESSSSKELAQISQIAKQIEIKNRAELCRMW